MEWKGKDAFKARKPWHSVAIKAHPSGVRKNGPRRGHDLSVRKLTFFCDNVVMKSE